MNKRSVIIVASFVLAIIALFVVRTQTTKRAAVVEHASRSPEQTSAAPTVATRKITADGVALPGVFADAVRADPSKGVILIEGRAATTEPLVLEIWRKGKKVLEKSLPLHVAPVEQMYTRVNLRDGAAAVTPGSCLPPANGTNVVFLHGFNVTPEEARAWHSEMFKRLWQSGSKARFHGVTWRGDIGGINVFRYHEDVVSAFATAPHLKSYVNRLLGQKVIMAHSLGNMVVSSAIADHGMSVHKYFMFHAAVAAEAFDSSHWCDLPDTANWMAHEHWRDYTNICWSAKWHEFFVGDPTDDRRKLTWKDRLASVSALTELYNYYSSGDEVLELFSGTPSSNEGMDIWDKLTWGWFAWHKQEVHKGRLSQGVTPEGTSWAGWGFVYSYTYQEPAVTSSWSGAVGPGFHMITPNGAFYPPAVQTESVLFSELGEHPVFLRCPASMFTNTIPVATQNELLARGLPALSGPTGGQIVNIKDVAGNPLPNRNINMDTVARPNGWGRNHDDLQMRWLHGDLKDMAFFYNHKLFEDVTAKGGLK